MQIDLWIADLDSQQVEPFRLLLSPDELERARRFRFDRDRHRFSVARGMLRSLLGNVLKRNPAKIEFSYAKRGKPFLAGEFIHFNVSHSHGIGVFAIARDREVGIDVEKIDPRLLEDGIAERFFSTPEVAMLRSLPQQLQTQAFFNCWTRKEAYIKACGEGLSLELDQFSVSLIPGEPAKLMHVKNDPTQAQRWSLVDLSVPPGFVGALCTEGSGWTLIHHE